MMNRRFLTVLGLSALLALVVSGIFYQVTTAVRSPRRGNVETRNVVVASNPLALGVLIKTSDLKVVPWPSANVPPGSFMKVEEAVDRVAMGNLVPEEPVLDGKLAARGSGLGLSPIIPPGMRAVSVRVNDVISVAGFVLPGSRVDVTVLYDQAARPNSMIPNKMVKVNSRARAASTRFAPRSVRAGR